MTESIKFVDGFYNGLTFKRGSGPGIRKEVGGKTCLLNSKNFWYLGNVAISAEYLEENKGNWIEV